MHTMTSPHPFNIPELLSKICYGLELTDFVSCTIVCRHWNLVFSPLVWRDVSIVGLKRKRAILSPEGMLGLMKNSLSIQSIQVQYVQALNALMSLPQENFRNISRFMIPASFQYHVPSNPESPFQFHIEAIMQKIIDRHTFENFPTSTEIEQPIISEQQRTFLPPEEQVPVDINRLFAFLSNLTLTELTLMTFPFDHGGALRTIIDMPRLERLKLVNHRLLVPDMKALLFLMRNLSPNLHYFGLSICFAEESREIDVDSISTTPPLLPKLQEILIDGDMKGSEENLFLPLIKRSPNLGKISISSSSRDFIRNLSKTLQEYCPKLCRFTMGATDRPLRDSDCAYFIRSSRAWKEVSMLRVTGFGSAAREALLEHTQSLESVTFSLCLGLPTLFLLQLLKACPNLIEFNPFEFESESRVAHINSFCNMDIAGVNSLRFFKCSFRFHPVLEDNAPYGSDAAPPVSDAVSLANQPENLVPQNQGAGGNTPQNLTVQQIQAQVQHSITQFPIQNSVLRNTGGAIKIQVYKRLATMAKLEELWIGDREIGQSDIDHALMIKPRFTMGTIPSVEPSLSFSRKEGLEYLEGMKELRVLGVRGIQHRIGIPELSWMLREWPKLERIDGLFDSKNGESGEVRQWLQSNAPFLKCT